MTRGAVASWSLPAGRRAGGRGAPGPLHAVGLTLALLALLPPAARGQGYWRASVYPYAYFRASDGWWGAVRYERYSPVGAVERPEPNLAALSFSGAASAAGSYAVMADAQAPAWWSGWRARLTLNATRDNRLGYYGIGNATPYVAESASALAPYFYKVSRTRAVARASGERRVVGPIRLVAGVALVHTEYRALPGPSVFARDRASGTFAPPSGPFTDRVVRTGVILDTRDHEIDPHRGLLLAAQFAGGTGYTRTSGDARLFVHPLTRLVLAGRLGAEGMGGTPPLAAQQDMESADRAFVAVGGYHSLRGYYDGRFSGRGKLIGGLEARYGLVWAPTLVELNLVAFYDAGRVFGPGEAVRLTSAALHRAGGGELALRFLRNALAILAYGRGSDGGLFYVATAWSY